MSLVSDIQELLDDAGVFFTDDVVYDKGNDALLAVWAETEHDRTTDTVFATASQEFIDVPSTIMIPKRIHAKGISYDVLTWTDLEEEALDWRNWTPARPERFVLFDTETLLAAPASDVNRYWRIDGVAYPDTTLSATATDITDIRAVKKAVAFRAAAMTAFLTRPDLSVQWLQQSGEFVQEARVKARVRKGGSLSFRPSRTPTNRERALSRGVQILDPVNPYA